MCVDTRTRRGYEDHAICVSCIIIHMCNTYVRNGATCMVVALTGAMITSDIAYIDNFLSCSLNYKIKSRPSFL